MKLRDAVPRQAKMAAPCHNASGRKRMLLTQCGKIILGYHVESSLKNIARRTLNLCAQSKRDRTSFSRRVTIHDSYLRTRIHVRTVI